MTAGCVAEELRLSTRQYSFALVRGSFVQLAVSPGFMPRPSLSEIRW